MVLRAMEGWETRQHTSYVDRLYTGGGFHPSVSTSGPRRAGLSCISTNYSAMTALLVSAVENTWIIGFAVRIRDDASIMSTGASGGVRLHDDAGTEQVALVIQPGAHLHSWKIEMRRGATVLATTAEFTTGGPRSWQYFQWKVTVRNGVNGAGELRRWGIEDTVHTVEFNVSGINAADTGTDGASRVQHILNLDGGSMQMDDLTIFDSTGALNNDFTSLPLVVLGMLPSGDGNHTDWTPSSGGAHWSLVDDPVGGAPADDEFVKSTVVGDKDSYDYDDLPEVVGASTAILGMHVVTTAKMVTSGSLTVAALIRSGGTDAAGADLTVDSLVILSFASVFDQNPIGPAAWTKSSVEAAEIGVEVT